jgi:hypothetical protein
MQTMSDVSQDNEKDRLSWRNSVLVWVVGAVLGWVVAVVAVYSALRSEDSAMIAQDRPALPEGHELADDSKARELNEVMPAAGDDAPADVGGREP